MVYFVMNVYDRTRTSVGGINEDFLTEGGWDLMVGDKADLHRHRMRKHDSFREVQLAQATYSITGKEELGTVARGRFSLCALPKSPFSLRGVGSHTCMWREPCSRMKDD